jgi:catechol 2,3-dioxygenase-like lactoylglutathione lyase family enzyme
MFSHIAFNTDRMDATIDFYAKLFGFTKGFALSDSEGNPWIEYLVNENGNFIELFYANSDKRYEHSDTTCGRFSHFCMEVYDISTVVKQAESCGIMLYKPLKLGLDKNMQCWFKDPNGILVEVMEMADDSPQTTLRRSLVHNKRSTFIK